MKRSAHQTLYVLSPVLILALIAFTAGSAYIIKGLSTPKGVVAGESTMDGTYEQSMTKDGKTYKVTKTISGGTITITTRVYDSSGNLIKEETKTKEMTTPTKSAPTEVPSKPTTQPQPVKPTEPTLTKPVVVEEPPIQLQGTGMPELIPDPGTPPDPALQGSGEVKRVQSEYQLSGAALTAKSNAPITINETTGTITVTTPTGEKELKNLPEEVIEKAYENNTVSTISKITINVDENSNVVYEVQGEKEYNILGLVKYKVPVTAKFNVENGNSTSMKKQWFKGSLGF